MSDVELFVESIEETCGKMTTDHCQKTELYGIPIASLVIDCKERLCLAQISNTLLKKFSYNEIHNRRVALGITCVQCTPIQLEILRRAGAMPISSRRCGMITKHEAERLVKSFLEETQPVKLPDNFAFDVKHTCSWGCQGNFIPARYNSSRAKCIKCKLCPIYLSPNKFIFHSHRLPDSKYQHPDAANFNSWRRHIKLANEDPSNELMHVWEDVKAMFNGGSRKRSLLTMKTSGTSDITAAGSFAPSSAKRTAMRFDTAQSAYSSIRTPVYPFMASPFMPKPFQNVGPEAFIPMIPPHRMRMESVGRPDYSPSFPMSSWKMAPFWLNSQMMGGSYLGKMGPGGHDAAWHELHGAPFRPLSSSDDLDVPPVTKMLNPHHVSAFTPVEYQRSMEELEDPLLKMTSPSRRESSKGRRLYIADKYSSPGPTNTIKKLGHQIRMDIAAADKVNMTKSSDALDEEMRMGFGVPIHSRARDASVQPETRTSIPILKVDNRQEDTLAPRRYSSTVAEQDIKQLTRSELEAKLEEAQTTLSNLTSSNASPNK